MVEQNRGEAVPGGPSPAIVLWMIVLGGYSALTGIKAIPQWSAYSTWTELYYGVSLAAGTCLASLGLIQALSRARRWFLPIAEVVVLVLLTANQLAGLLWDAIICYTPG